MSRNPMDICLLVNGQSIPWWQADAIDYLLENTDANITTIVYNEYEQSRTIWETLKRGMELREWAVISIMNNILLSPQPQREPVDIGDLINLNTVTELNVEPNIVEGWKQSIPTQTVDRISEDSDVAIRFGFGFLVGPILSELQYGVLSYHHGDLREYRGQPMGFWEFIHGENKVGITVQQLSNKLDAGKIVTIKSIPINDLYTWEAIKHRLLIESEDMLADAIQSIQNNEVVEPDKIGKLYTLPSGVSTLKFAIKNLKGHLIKNS